MVPPDWLREDILKKIFESEKDRETDLSVMPNYYYMEIATLLINQYEIDQ